MRKSICSKAFSFLLMLFAFGLQQAAAQTTIGLTGTTQATCNGTPTGDITVNVTLDPFATTCDVKLDSAGVLLQTKPILISGNLTFSNVNAFNGYTVIATDDVGTTVNVTGINVTEPAALVLTANKYDVTCNGNGDGAIKLNATGGTVMTGYVFKKGTGSYAAIDTFSNFTPGTYTFYVQDDNSCEENISVTITEPAQLLLSISVNNSICNDGTASVTLSASGGTTPYTFDYYGSGTFGSTTNFLNQSDTSGITSAVKDANGCH